MSDDPHLPSTPVPDTGGTGEGRESRIPAICAASEERGADGLTPRKRERLARKVARANLALAEAGASAGTGLKKAVGLLNDSLQGEKPPKGTELVRTTDCLHRITKDAARVDRPDPSEDGMHLHLHGELDELQKAIAERIAPGSAPRVNENGHDGNGRA